MVVALRAAEAHPEEDVGGRVGQVFEDHSPLLTGVALVVFVDPVAEVSGGHDRLRVLRGELVAGDLFADELVVRLVAAEGRDDVIAVVPGVRPVGVLLVAVGIGIADEVEPEAGVLAIPRACEEPVDEPLVRSGDESERNASIPASRRRRQTSQVLIQTPDEGGRTHLGRAGAIFSASRRLSRNRSMSFRGQAAF